MTKKTPRLHGVFPEGEGFAMSDCAGSAVVR